VGRPGKIFAMPDSGLTFTIHVSRLTPHDSPLTLINISQIPYIPIQKLWIFSEIASGKKLAT